jgi:vacuolar-type H+-ATPase subunit I/STV1
MSTAVAKQRERVAVARPLKVLIPLIKADIERGDRAGMEYYADAGDKLIEAKEQVAYGYWGAWLSKNFDRSDRQARLYMRYAQLRAEHVENRAASSVLPSSLTEMRGETARARERREADREFRAAVREIEPDLYKEEKQTRTDEIQLHRDLALELIDVGFKALATRLHPDKHDGGSKEAMARLNRVRAELKSVAETRRFV